MNSLEDLNEYSMGPVSYADNRPPEWGWHPSVADITVVDEGGAVQIYNLFAHQLLGHNWHDLQVGFFVDVAWADATGAWFAQIAADPMSWIGDFDVGGRLLRYIGRSNFNDPREVDAWLKNTIIVMGRDFEGVAPYGFNISAPTGTMGLPDHAVFTTDIWHESQLTVTNLEELTITGGGEYFTSALMKLGGAARILDLENPDTDVYTIAVTSSHAMSNITADNIALASSANFASNTLTMVGTKAALNSILQELKVQTEIADAEITLTYTLTNPLSGLVTVRTQTVVYNPDLAYVVFFDNDIALSHDYYDFGSQVYVQQLENSIDPIIISQPVADRNSLLDQYTVDVTATSPIEWNVPLTGGTFAEVQAQLAAGGRLLATTQAAVTITVTVHNTPLEFSMTHTATWQETLPHVWAPQGVGSPTGVYVLYLANRYGAGTANNNQVSIWRDSSNIAPVYDNYTATISTVEPGNEFTIGAYTSSNGTIQVSGTMAQISAAIASNNPGEWFVNTPHETVTWRLTVVSNVNAQLYTTRDTLSMRIELEESDYAPYKPTITFGTPQAAGYEEGMYVPGVDLQIFATASFTPDSVFASDPRYDVYTASMTANHGTLTSVIPLVGGTMAEVSAQLGHVLYSEDFNDAIITVTVTNTATHQQTVAQQIIAMGDITILWAYEFKTSDLNFPRYIVDEETNLRIRSRVIPIGAYPPLFADQYTATITAPTNPLLSLTHGATFSGTRSECILWLRDASVTIADAVPINTETLVVTLTNELYPALQTSMPVIIDSQYLPVVDYTEDPTEYIWLARDREDSEFISEICQQQLATMSNHIYGVDANTPTYSAQVWIYSAVDITPGIAPHPDNDFKYELGQRTPHSSFELTTAAFPNRISIENVSLLDIEEWLNNTVRARVYNDCNPRAGTTGIATRRVQVRLFYDITITNPYTSTNSSHNRTVDSIPSGELTQTYGGDYMPIETTVRYTVQPGFHVTPVIYNGDRITQYTDTKRNFNINADIFGANIYHTTTATVTPPQPAHGIYSASVPHYIHNDWLAIDYTDIAADDFEAAANNTFVRRPPTGWFHPLYYDITTTVGSYSVKLRAMIEQ